MIGMQSLDFAYNGDSHEKTMRRVNHWMSALTKTGADIDILNAETILRGEHCSAVGIRIYYLAEMDLPNLSLPLKDRLGNME